MLECDLKTQLGDFSLQLKFSLPSEGITVIFGQSGSGKSSLLNMIAGFDQPTEYGSIRFNDQNWLALSSNSKAENTAIQQRKIAYVTQAPCLFELLSFKKNLQYAIDRQHQKKINDSDSYLSLASVSQHLNINYLWEKFPSQLSGGEKQRVAIARAIVSAPQLMLFDEPLNGLDEQHREQILHHLEHLHQHFSIPILYVTHNMEELMRLADRVLVLQQGSLLAQKDISDVLSDLTLPFSRHHQAGAVISAKVHASEKNHHLIQLALGNGGFLWVNSPSLAHATGEKIRLRIYARDISITRQPASDSSILNILPASIIDIIDLGKGQAILKLHCYQQILLARLTNKSIEQLKLNKGDHIFAQIKGIAILGAGLQ